ncbi:MAG: FAD-dependent oxidoreductase [Pseudomonadota bacterium]
MNTDTLIIGAGLSGLHIAWRLQRLGVDARILEARPRIGGRVLSRPYHPSDSSNRFDLGPSWLWPHNRNLLNLVHELGLDDHLFEQYDKGGGIFESSDGTIHRNTGGMKMSGSLRLQGGIGSVTDCLLSQLRENSVSLNQPVSHIKFANGVFTVRTSNRDQSNTFTADRVILTTPPRVACQAIQFQPELTADTRMALKNTQTWMASQAKVVIQYNDAFWRRNGLSGDAFSQQGPLREIHDASSSNASQAALFGFVDGHTTRSKISLEDYRTLVAGQMGRIFGSPGRHPTHIHLLNWSSEELTCTPLDVGEPPRHSFYTLTFGDKNQFENRLLWAGTEFADARSHANGYLEGAVTAGWQVISQITG